MFFTIVGPSFHINLKAFTSNAFHFPNKFQLCRRCNMKEGAFISYRRENEISHQRSFFHFDIAALSVGYNGFVSGSIFI